MSDTQGQQSSDELLAQAVARGSTALFEELVARHQAAVFSLLLRLVRNHDDAQELAQETFLKVFRHLGQYNPAQSFRTWLLTIATNTALNHLDARRLRKTVALPREEAAGSALSPLLQASRQELLQRIETALQRFSAKARAMFMLRYQQGLSCDEISRMLGESLSNVKVSLMRTRERLRQELMAQEQGG